MISDAMREFLQDLLDAANLSHISVIADPVTPSITIQLEASDDDLKDLSALLGEVSIKDTDHA